MQGEECAANHNGRHLSWLHFFKTLVRSKEALKFEIKPLKEQVYQLTHNKWQVYSTTSFSTTVVCDRTLKPIIIDFSTTIELNPGCKLRLQSHLLYAEHEDKITMPGLHFTWAWNASTLFHSAFKIQFSAALQSLHDYGLHIVKAADIAHHLKLDSFNDAIQSDITNLFSNPFDYGSIIIAFIIQIIVFVSIYCCYQTRRSTTKPLQFNTDSFTTNQLFPYTNASAPTVPKQCPVANIC